MKNIRAIIASGIMNNLRSRSLTIVNVTVSIMVAAGLVILFALILIKPAIESGQLEKREMENHIGLLTYIACVIGLGINLNVYAFQSMTREKARGSLESLLATPIGLKEVWVAKSLSVFLPGLLAGILFGTISLMAVNFIYFMPSTGFLFTCWSGINSFFAGPLVFLLLSFLVHLVGLTGSTATANVISQVSLQVVLIFMINISSRNLVDASSWSFFLVNLGLAFIVSIMIVLFRHRLRVEKAILSI